MLYRPYRSVSIAGGVGLRPRGIGTSHPIDLGCVAAYGLTPRGSVAYSRTVRRLEQTLSALLLVGWLFVLPPGITSIPPADFRAAGSRPLAEWNQIQAFDTAQACEAFRKSVTGDVLLQPHLSPSVEERAMAYTQGRCVPSETIYPPAK